MNELSGLTPHDGIRLMVSFADRVKYPHDATSPYGDTLLFEYGVFDWGKGENFELTITRQVIFPFTNPIEADDHIIQISITFRYEPTAFRDLTNMTMWASDLPPKQSMENFVNASPGYLVAADMVPKEIQLHSSAQ
ncbi:MAG: hypothetical protein IPG93_20065 [Burkholderiales bacterium]|nr:hypothetical protein [Burkholderiales bacterium]